LRHDLPLLTVPRLPPPGRQGYIPNMNERVKHIADQARQLTQEELAELMDTLADMAEEDSGPIDPALAAECERRWEAYEHGEVKSYSWEEVKAQLRKL
jgi:putative addiction module component (TIGR02574 family)